MWGTKGSGVAHASLRYIEDRKVWLPCFPFCMQVRKPSFSSWDITGFTYVREQPPSFAADTKPSSIVSPILILRLICDIYGENKMRIGLITLWMPPCMERNARRAQRQKPSTQSLYNKTQSLIYYATPNPFPLRAKIPLQVNSITTSSLWLLTETLLTTTPMFERLFEGTVSSTSICTDNTSPG